MGSRPSSIAFHRSRLRGPPAAPRARLGGAGRVVPAAHLGPGGHPADGQGGRGDATTAATSATGDQSVARRCRPCRRATASRRRGPRRAPATSRPPWSPGPRGEPSSPRTATTRRTRPRVTSSDTPAASTTRLSAPGERHLAAPGRGRHAGPAPASSRGRRLDPGPARRPAPPAPRGGSPSSTTGPNVRRGLTPSAHRDQVGVEAGAVAGVAGRALLVDLDQQGVAVAVEPDLLDPLPVAGGLALDPVLLARAAPVRRPAGRQRAGQRLVVHPAQHQHLAGVVLLHHRRHQPVGALAA